VYTVRAGDNYWGISRRHYGTGRYFQALTRYNAHRIPDPRRIRPGMKVLIPAREILDSRYADLIPGRRASSAVSPGPAGLFPSSTGELMYRVGRNDTLGLIAQRHLGRWTRWAEIYRLNQDRLRSPTTLRIGAELRLPADASQVRVVSESVERR
jgi:nucleoid-associated protein YgaU